MATDLLAGTEAWFQQGPVDAAIRASISLPSFISPIVLNGRLLADGGPSTAGAAPVQESAEPRPTEEWLERSRRTVAELPPGLRTVDVMRLSLDALQSVVTRYRLAGYPPDLLVTIPRAACRTLDFHRAGEMIELGRTRAAEALDASSVPEVHPPPRSI